MSNILTHINGLQYELQAEGGFYTFTRAQYDPPAVPGIRLHGSTPVGGFLAPQSTVATSMAVVSLVEAPNTDSVKSSMIAVDASQCSFKNRPDDRAFCLGKHNAHARAFRVHYVGTCVGEADSYSCLFRVVYLLSWDLHTQLFTAPGNSIHLAISRSQ